MSTKKEVDLQNLTVDELITIVNHHIDKFLVLKQLVEEAFSIRISFEVVPDDPVPTIDDNGDPAY